MARAAIQRRAVVARSLCALAAIQSAFANCNRMNYGQKQVSPDRGNSQGLKTGKKAWENYRDAQMISRLCAPQTSQMFYIGGACRIKPSLGNERPRNPLIRGEYSDRSMHDRLAHDTENGQRRRGIGFSREWRPVAYRQIFDWVPQYLWVPYG